MIHYTDISSVYFSVWFRRIFFILPLPVVFLVRVHDNTVVVDDVGKGHGARHDLEDGGHARPRGEHVLSLPAVVGPRGGLDHGIGGFVATAQPRHKLGQLHFGEFGVLGPIISWWIVCSMDLLIEFFWIISPNHFDKRRILRFNGSICVKFGVTQPAINSWNKYSEE